MVGIVSCRSTDSLTSCHQNDLTSDQPHQPTRTPVQWWTQAEHSRLKSGLPLLTRLGIHKNNHVSDTKLTLGLRVGFIALTWQRTNSSQLTREQSQVHRLEAKSLHALIIKPCCRVGTVIRTPIYRYKGKPIPKKCETQTHARDLRKHRFIKLNKLPIQVMIIPCKVYSCCYQFCKCLTTVVVL